MVIVIGYELDEHEPNIFGLYKTQAEADRRIEELEAEQDFTYLTTKVVKPGDCNIAIRI